MKINKILLILLLVLLVGCGKTTPKQEDDAIKSVEFENKTGLYSNFIDKFTLEEVKIKVTYNNGKTEIIPLTKDMISQTDFEKLFTADNHIIEVKYLDYTLNAFIEIIETSSGQGSLPSIVVFSLTKKVDDKYVSTYYSLGRAKYISYQVQYIYNDAKVTDIEVSKAENVNGSFVSSVKDGLVTITYTQTDNVSELTELFSITYKSDSKHFNFVINYLYDNAFYSYNDSNVFVINNVGYFDR